MFIFLTDIRYNKDVSAGYKVQNDSYNEMLPYKYDFKLQYLDKHEHLDLRDLSHFVYLLDDPNHFVDRNNIYHFVDLSELYYFMHLSKRSSIHSKLS